MRQAREAGADLFLQDFRSLAEQSAADCCERRHGIFEKRSFLTRTLRSSLAREALPGGVLKIATRDEWERYEWLARNNLTSISSLAFRREQDWRMEAVTNQHPPSGRATRLSASGSAKSQSRTAGGAGVALLTS